ncbi:DNA-3-methyladenine glycosylase I [Allosediminivita pacifica]|uniref:DNA-3-methyladenine glycosylase I n=1 Tax=Allosediminivita pacifica TaxID=1267769 RepID=A0A2T6B0W7_9RHOB|nr:DNA-3-methyladenine glycosylase I [Allosediminivita pacifica]PTX49655.1 DNA-3-methyladenine glycosylase I [Allosediminivita pacifica]GGB03581.1 3-methyladenine DNA glycosylase [Allosediminivita pacifica]
MRRFEDILDEAAARHGGREAVLADIAEPKSAEEIATVPDDRWLAEVARGIFRAGLSWDVVETKWDGIEAAFDGFDTGKVAGMSEDRFDRLLADSRVIRSGAKIAAIRDNAVFIREVSEAHGSFGARVAEWPGEEFADLLQWMRKEGARLGGNTGAMVMRTMGKDGYMLSRDVVARLVEEGVIEGPPKSKHALTMVQAAFNMWQGESGLSLTAISKVLARSMG